MLEEDEEDNFPDARLASTPPPNSTSEFQSPGARSSFSISGTTAFSTYSEGEAADLDRDVIISDLPTLYNAAGELLRVIAPLQADPAKLAEIVQETKKPGSVAAKRLHGRERSFIGYQENFGNAHDYISSQTVMKSIFSAHTLPSRDSPSWRLIEILQTANLAWLAKWVVGAEQESSHTFDPLRTLDSAFPLDFLSSIFQSQSGSSASWMIGSSTLLTETFQIGLDIRTQLAVTVFARRHTERGFNHEQAVRDIFYNPPESDSSEDDKLRAWNINGLGSGEMGLLQEFDQQLLIRIATIKQCFLEDTQAIIDGNSSELSKLQARFPWSGFTVQVLDWVRRRNHELLSSIKKRGGVDAIVSNLKQEFDLDDSLIPTSTTPNRVPQRTTPRVSVRKNTARTRYASPINVSAKYYLPSLSSFDARGFKEFKKRHSNVGATVPSLPNTTAEEVAGIAEEHAGADHGSQRTGQDERIAPTNPGQDDWRPLEDLDSSPLSVEPSCANATPPAIRNFLKVRKANKENAHRSQPPALGKRPRSLLDAQHDAKELHWDDETQAPPQLEQAADRRPTQIRNGMENQDALREEPQEHDDVTDDEGFQNDIRPANHNHRRERPSSSSWPQSSLKRQRSAGPARSSAARFGLAENEDGEEEEEIEGEGEEGSRSNGSAEPREKLVEQFNHYARNTQQSTQQIARTQSGPRQPQVRRKWTDREETALIDAIRRHSTNWAGIKREDSAGPQRLVDRDQVSLKDKAGIMKLNYLQ